VLPYAVRAAPALLRGANMLHICQKGRRGCGGCDSPAIRLLNSGRILYTLNRADRFGAGGNAAGGLSILVKEATEERNRRGFSPFRIGTVCGIIAHPVRSALRNYHAFA